MTTQIYKPETKTVRYLVIEAEYRVDYENGEEILIDFSDPVEVEPVTDAHGATELFIYNGVPGDRCKVDAAAWVQNQEALNAELGIRNKSYQILEIKI